MRKNTLLYLITKSSWGGAQKYVYYLASEMARQGYRVTVGAGPDELQTNGIFQSELEHSGVEFVSVNNFKKQPDLLKDIKALKELKQLFAAHKPEILHLNSTKAGLLGALAARMFTSARVIFTAHGLPYNEKRNWLMSSLIKLASYITFALSDVVIVLSDSEKQNVCKCFHKKIVVIPNAVPDFSMMDKSTAQEKLLSRIKKQVSPDTVWIVGIAELTTNKNLSSLLDKLSNIKDKDFIYIHFGTGELKQFLLEKTKRLGLQDKVFWLGFDPQARVYIKAFDLFVLPSQKEGMPFALLEAGKAGLWIWANKVGAIPEMLDCSVQKDILGFSACKLKPDFDFAKMVEKTKNIYENNYQSS